MSFATGQKIVDFSMGITPAEQKIEFCFFGGEPLLCFDLLKREDVDLCISIDGPAHVHDLNRCYADGHGSFVQVARKLRKAVENLDHVQVNAVYSPETIDFLAESVSFFTRLGVPVIHLNPNICASRTRNTHSKLRETYMEIANYYIKRYERGHEIAVNLIDSELSSASLTIGIMECWNTGTLGLKGF
jgi:sulfatase maturation enzyme AslB (radical SAM superfamily)